MIRVGLGDRKYRLVSIKVIDVYEIHRNKRVCVCIWCWCRNDTIYHKFWLHAGLVVPHLRYVQCCEKFFLPPSCFFFLHIFFAVFKLWFHLLRENSCPNLPGPTWKINCPLNLITGCGTLCSNNCNQAFAVTGNESFTSLWRNFGPLFFAELF